MAKLLGIYKNGNYIVELYDDGTKIRITNEDTFEPEFPESIDITITNKCDNNCKFCFVEETFVETNNGQIKISELQKNDLVISYNKNIDKKELKKILNTSKRYYSGEIVKLEFENNYVILCTPNHKIYTKNRGYVQAKDLTNIDEFIKY